MKEKIELKPCPFCGGKSQVRENYLGQTFVFCERCGSKTWFTQDDICVRKDIVINNWNSRKQSEWISVEDRLPERNGRYITHCKIEGESLVCVLYYCKVGGFNEGTVTHWMPLPEPPKMKGGE